MNDKSFSWHDEKFAFFALFGELKYDISSIFEDPTGRSVFAKSRLHSQNSNE
jgi:hypothetical protein